MEIVEHSPREQCAPPERTLGTGRAELRSRLCLAWEPQPGHPGRPAPVGAAGGVVRRLGPLHDAQPRRLSGSQPPED